MHEMSVAAQQEPRIVFEPIPIDAHRTRSRNCRGEDKSAGPNEAFVQHVLC